MTTSPRTRVARGRARVDPAVIRGHLRDPLYRNSYFLIIGTGMTSLLGVVFWALAAHEYSAHDVGLNSAVISAMTLVSGVASLGLSAVLIRYLPIAGRSTRALVTRSYLLTGVVSLFSGIIVALTSELWSPKLSFLGSGAWLIGFTASVVAFTIFTLEDSVLTGLRVSQWIPLENTTYSLAKIALLFGLAIPLPAAGLFAAWTIPLLPTVLIVNYLIYRRLVPRSANQRSLLDRRKVISMATGNYGGNLFSLIGLFFLPILVANVTSAREEAYFYVPWLIVIALQLVAINVMSSLTVEAALDMPSMVSLCRRALTHTARLVLPFAALTALLAPWILVVFGQDYADAGTSLLRLLALGALPNIVVTLGTTIGRIEHRGGVVVASQGATAIFLIGFSAALLPDTGITGVGIAWIASQTLVAIGLLATTLRPFLLSRPAAS